MTLVARARPLFIKLNPGPGLCRDFAPGQMGSVSTLRVAGMDSPLSMTCSHHWRHYRLHAVKSQ